MSVRLTLRDVAQRANVSPSTVSRVLNNYRFVDEETRNVVLQAAQAVGYSLENLRSPTAPVRTVLLLTRFAPAQTGAELLSGIEQAIAIGAQSIFDASGIMAHVQQIPHNQDDFTLDPGIIGVILLGGVLDRNFVQALLERRVPFIVAGSHVQPLQVNCVMADYRDGMTQAVTHLVAQHRHRIGLVNGPATTTSSAEKLAGYRLALALHELPFVADRVVASDFSPESGHAQTRRLLQQAPDLDAIAFGDDTMALGGVHALKELGYRIPNDVAVTGFYNYAASRFTDPPLTSVSFDMQGMGVIAAQRLLILTENKLGRANQEERPWPIVLPTTLIVRASSNADGLLSIPTDENVQE